VNTTEAHKLLKAVQEIDHREITENMVGVWAHALATIAYPEALTAMREHHRTSVDYLKVAHIVAIVRSRRNAGSGFAGKGEIWRRCPWPSCQCTHDGECVAGWIDGDGSTRPCPTCRPEVARHLLMNPDDKFTRDGLRYLPRPSRQGSAESGAA